MIPKYNHDRPGRVVLSEKPALSSSASSKQASIRRVEWVKGARVLLEGAALQVGSSIGWQQAAPGNVSTCGSSIGFALLDSKRRTRWAKRHAGRLRPRPIELLHVETFSGAARCRTLELPHCKAAPPPGTCSSAEPPRESTYSFPNARFRGRRRGRLRSV